MNFTLGLAPCSLRFVCPARISQASVSFSFYCITASVMLISGTGMPASSPPFSLVRVNLAPSFCLAVREMKFNWICIGIRLNRLCKHFVSFHLRVFRLPAWETFGPSLLHRPHIVPAPQEGLHVNVGILWPAPCRVEISLKSPKLILAFIPFA